MDRTLQMHLETLPIPPFLHRPSKPTQSSTIYTPVELPEIGKFEKFRDPIHPRAVGRSDGRALRKTGRAATGGDGIRLGSAVRQTSICCKWAVWEA